MINLRVTYRSGLSVSDSTVKIDVSNADGSKSLTRTYTVAELNALVSDNVPGSDPANKAYDLHFTGNFKIGLGGNLNRCAFTNVSFYCNSDVELNWNNAWGSSWSPYQ